MTLAELNALPPEAARDELARCCGASRWAAAMAARRPFASREALFAAAEAYKNAKDYDNARKYYGMVSDKYPEDSLSNKSKNRINSIINK